MIRVVVAAIGLVLCASALAGPGDFHAGSRIKGFGRIAAVDAAPKLPPETVLKVAFDVSEAGASDTVNRKLDSAARFINMHAAAGLRDDQVQVAVVVHGKASQDLLTAEKLGRDNPNQALIAALIEAGVSISLCGQTAAYYDIGAGDLLPGVNMALSAMTQHALLQQQGYSLNPF